MSDRIDNEDNANLAATINRIAELVMSQETTQSVLDLIVGLAETTVPAAAGVSVSIRENGRYTMAARSSDDIAELDAIQHRDGAGPCVHALRTNEETHVVDLATDERWPRYAQAALAKGFRSVLSIPFAPVDEAIGALNLYAAGSDAFGEDQREMARMVSRQAAIAYANSGSFVRAAESNDQLRAALESRDTIGQAKGILMERDGLTPDEAFDQMRAESQSSQRKLRDLAAEIVRGVKERKDR